MAVTIALASFLSCNFKELQTHEHLEILNFDCRMIIGFPSIHGQTRLFQSLDAHALNLC